MIDARELRKGNLVTDGFYGTFKTVIKVESVDSKGINSNPTVNASDLYRLDIEMNYEYLTDELFGIPLTEEWFLRFGLIKLRSPIISFVLGCYEISLIPTSEEYGVYLQHGRSITKIKYVHQLQNLYFALTNEELTVKED